MRGLNSFDFVRLWEDGLDQHPLDRALAILRAGYPELAYQQLVTLPIGQRDALLIALYDHCFGSIIPAQAHCPKCNEAVEFTLSTQELLSANGEANEQNVLQIDGYELTFRLPTSADLAKLVQSNSHEDAGQRLRSDCLLALQIDGKASDSREIPAAIVSALAAEMARLDPLAAIEIDLRCPTCQQQWSALFDIVDHFWAEITVAAQRLLYEVHLLAAAYGWSEAEILGLSSRRRRFYLTQIGS